MMDVAYTELEHSSIRLATHLKGTCIGEHCTIHNRSDHPMRSFPQFWRSERGIMERTCTHGIGHPDPDEYKLHATGGELELVHNCDGCCEGSYEFIKKEDN